MAKDAKEIWFSSLASKLNGADDSVIVLELGNSMREFFEHSLAWQVELGGYDLPTANDLNLNEKPDGGTGLYPDDLYARIVYIMEVRVGDVFATPTTYDQTVRFSSPSTGRFCYICPTPSEITFYPTPAEAQTGTVFARAALTPQGCDNELPDFIATHYFEPILDGALGRLYMYPKHPWSNSTLGTYHLRRFRNEMAKARDIASRRFTRSDPQFSAGSTAAWNSTMSSIRKA
jgi:hypothetical protein